MDSKEEIVLRIFATCFATVLAWLIILSFCGVAGTASAQNPSAEKVIYNFAPATGDSPAGLAGDSAGNLYVAARDGGSNRKCGGGCGSILRLSRPYGQPTTLYTFAGYLGNRNQEANGLIRGASGSLYGTAYAGGRNGIGSVFKVSPSGSAGILYSFQGGNDGAGAEGGVTLDSASNLYGTTAYGGGTSCNSGSGCGIVYKLTPSGSETILYRFTGGADGEVPVASPILDAASSLYGTAAAGGDLSCAQGQGFGCGTVWKLDTSGNLTVLYTFTGGTDGAEPVASLVMDSSGNLYGVADEGGNLSCSAGFGFGCGVVFEISSSGNFTVLWTFGNSSGDGLFPGHALIRDSSGNLYGTTNEGGDPTCSLNGTPGCGVVFKIGASGNETILHAFTEGTTDGQFPETGLITDGKGNLYGTTSFGGLADEGVIFQVQMQ
jgi:uncharacterized repeat protein (TIGR03803 family)